MKTTIYVLRENESGDEVEIAVDVEYSVSGKHVPAIRDVSDEEWPELEIESATGPDGKEIKLTDSDIVKVQENADQVEDR